MTETYQKSWSLIAFCKSTNMQSSISRPSRTFMVLVRPCTLYWYNNLKYYIHLVPNPTSANNLHSHKLQLPRYPPLNESTDMTAIHKCNIYHNRLKPNNHTPSTAQPEDRESRERSSFYLQLDPWKGFEIKLIQKISVTQRCMGRF